MSPLGRIAPHVDRLDLRHFGDAVPRFETQAPVAPLIGIDDGFERGRGRTQHDRKRPQRGAHHRHVARVIGNAVFLLEGRFMLLVDNDQAEFGKGQEERRARADHDTGAAFGDAAPDPRPLARRQVGMPFGRTAAETLFEAVEKLLRQRDLGQQDQHLAAAPQRFGHGLEIDFRLARAGDAVEQRRRKGVRGHRGDKCGGGFRLIGPERHAPCLGVGQRERRLGRHFEWRQRAGLDQPAHDAVRNAGLLGQFADAAGKAVAGRCNDALAGGRHARRTDIGQPAGDSRPRRLQGAGRADGEPQNRTPRGQRVAGHPVDKAPQRLGHGRRIEALDDGFQPFALDRVGARAPDHTDQLLRAQRHHHIIARRQHKIRRHRIIIGLRQRQRHQNRDTRGRGACGYFGGHMFRSTGCAPGVHSKPRRHCNAS